MALPYADAVANLRAAGITGTDYTNALSSLNNAYGIGTPTGPNAGAAAAEPVDTAIPTGTAAKPTYTTPTEQSNLQANNLPTYKPTGAPLSPPVSTTTSTIGGPQVGLVIRGGAANTAGTTQYSASYAGNGQWNLTDSLGRSYGTVDASTLSSRGFTNVPQSAPTQTPIPNPITPLTTTNPAGFTVPQGNAGTVADNFNTSIASTLAAAQNALATSLKDQAAGYQQKIDALNQQNQELQAAKDQGLADYNSTISQETQQKQAALEAEQQQFQTNYDASQKLTDQLGTLLTTGQQVIQQMKDTTGLTSIMSPRISKTMTDVQAQAGVITATLSALSGQIGLAQNQLKSATDAITSIYSDQITYYQNVISFYDSEQKTNNTQIATLSADQKTYVDAQISMLQDNVKNAQAMATIIGNAMLDPTTALAYASAGVALNDSPQSAGAKLATYQYSKEISDTNNKMAAAGYSTSPVAGVTPVPITDSQGKTTMWYNTKQGAPKVFGSASGGYYTVSADGTVTPLVGGSKNSSSTVGTDLTDAYNAIQLGAEPMAVRQKFLSAHPTAGSDWNNYFGSGGTTANPLTYPTPTTSNASSGFDLFKPSTWGSLFNRS